MSLKLRDDHFEYILLFDGSNFKIGHIGHNGQVDSGVASYPER
jgi:hypothetical protein